MIVFALAAALIAPLLAVPAGAGTQAPAAPRAPGMSADELETLRRSLRPAGLAELESHAAALAQLPLAEVEAQLDLDQARVEGHLRLLFTNRERAPIPDLVLRLLPSAPALKAGSSLRADEVAVDGRSVRSRAHGSLLEIALAEPLAPGAALTLTLAFHGKLARVKPGEDGLAPTAALLGQAAGPGGRASGSSDAASRGYGTFAVSEAGAVLLDWYPLLAARVGGAWDKGEPGLLGDPLRADVGSAIVSLTVGRGLSVVGAGSALGQHESGAGSVAAFALAGLRGALPMVVLRDAELVSDEMRPEGDEGAPPVRLRVASLHGPQGTRALLACVRTALRELAPRWGPYPWSDLVLAEAPLTGGAGGVEQSGFALLGRALGGGVSDPFAAPQNQTDPLPSAPGLFTFTCHHEIAHQWFPGVVGSNPRGAAWLDEALAQDAAVRVAAAAAGGGDEGKLASEEASRRFVALNYQGMRLIGQADGRIERRTDEFRNPVAYAGLIYGKAPLYLARVRALIGDEKFDAALRGLRAQRAFREASSADLLASFVKQDPARKELLDALADRWLREVHGDEEIAPLDASDLLENLGGAGGGAGVSQLMRVLGQGAGGSGKAPDEKAMRRMLREMEKTMPELKEILRELGAGAPP